MKLVVATTNPGKLSEIEDILARRAGSRVELVIAARFSSHRRTGRNRRHLRRERAAEGAVLLRGAPGLPSVADDSGLEIDALDNAPGVHSARWHGTDYAVKFPKIYELLRERGVATQPGAVRLPRRAGATRPDHLRSDRRSIEGEIAPSRGERTASATTPSFSIRPSAAPLPSWIWTKSHGQPPRPGVRGARALS